MKEGEHVFDEDGFLRTPDLWSDTLARKMAQDQFNILLTAVHLKAISFVREYYLKWGSLPMVKTIREHLKINNEQMNNLFRRGKSSAREVLCKISGLPKNLCIASGC